MGKSKQTVELTTKTERGVLAVDGTLKAGAAGAIDSGRKGENPGEGAVKNAIDKAAGVPVSKAVEKGMEYLEKKEQNQ